MHFLPFKNQKRDELFSLGESYHKVAPAFTYSDPGIDKASAISALRDYLKQYQIKIKNRENFKENINDEMDNQKINREE